MKGWTHISISMRTLKRLEKIIEILRSKGIEPEPRRKKDVSYDRAILELIKYFESHQKCC